MRKLREEVERALGSFQRQQWEPPLPSLNDLLLQAQATADAFACEWQARCGDSSKLEAIGARIWDFARAAPDSATDALVSTLAQNMTPAQREIALMRAETGLSYREIAAQLNMKVKTVVRAEIRSLCLADRAIATLPAARIATSSELLEKCE